MQHTWLKPAVFLSIFLLFLCYIFKNSSTVKKNCVALFKKASVKKVVKLKGQLRNAVGCWLNHLLSDLTLAELLTAG